MKEKYTKRFNKALPQICQPVHSELVEIFDSIYEILGKDIFQIYLIGSAARGEHVSKEISGETFVYSDIEFLVFVKSNAKKNLAYIKEIIDSVQSRSKIKGICYKYDVGIFHSYRRFFMPNSLWYLELVEKGVPVYCRKYQKKMRFMPFSKFDFGNLNELLLIRLWNFLSVREKTTEDHELRMNLTRNAMELVTILVFHRRQNIFGYQKRINFFHEIDAPKDVKSFLMQCYEERYKNCSSPDNLKQLTKKFISAYLYTFGEVTQNKNTTDIKFYLSENFDCNLLWKNISGIFEESFLKRIRRFYLDFKFLRKLDYSFFDSARLCLEDKIRPQLFFGLIRNMGAEIFEYEVKLQPIWIESVATETKKSIAQLTTMYLMEE